MCSVCVFHILYTYIIKSSHSEVLFPGFKDCTTGLLIFVKYFNLCVTQFSHL